MGHGPFLPTAHSETSVCSDARARCRSSMRASSSARRFVAISCAPQRGPRPIERKELADLLQREARRLRLAEAQARDIRLAVAADALDTPRRRKQAASLVETHVVSTPTLAAAASFPIVSSSGY